MIDFLSGIYKQTNKKQLQAVNNFCEYLEKEIKRMSYTEIYIQKFVLFRVKIKKSILIKIYHKLIDFS